MRVIDLTLPLGINTPVYSDAHDYRDPAIVVETWATHDEHGYSVHRLEMGTHSGTHIDAPSHFHPERLTIDQVTPEALVGQVVPIDVRSWDRVTAEALRPYTESVRDGGLPLFLAPDTGIAISTGAVAAVVEWRPTLVLYTGQFVDEGECYHHNREWLGEGILLVTDIDPQAASEVHKGDFLIVAPLRLVGLDGSPCRVFVLQTASQAERVEM